MIGSAIHPGLIFIVGGIILPFLRKRVFVQIWQLILPVIAFIQLFYLEEGVYGSFNFLGYELILGRVDRLSICFAYIFVIITLIGMIYSLHVEEWGQHSAAFLYAGSALGVVFAGDFFSLFACWELMAVSSTFLIMYGRGEKSLRAGFRYLMVHLFGGCALLAGIVIYVGESGSIVFSEMETGHLSTMLILLGFIVNGAVPPFHPWLPDAYPESSVTGGVFLTAFTTKSAVYVLLRGFPGAEILVWLGAFMALYGVIYAILENDLRRLLSYHIVSQVGFMVCGVGLGSELSMNGSAAHAISHILYKALLFMGAGAVIEATGRRKISELEGKGIYKELKGVFYLYMIGAFSISAVPLFNGFISKNMIVFASGELHRPAINTMLHLASVGTFLSLALKLPYGTWFGKRKEGGNRDEMVIKSLPFNMYLGMAIASFLCIFMGIYPKILYDLLPFPVSYRPYTPYNVLGMVQLLLYTAFAYFAFKDRLKNKAALNIDTDWFYRRGGKYFFDFCKILDGKRTELQGRIARLVENAVRFSINPIQTMRYLVGNKRIYVVPYSADRYRQPIGIGVMFFLIFICLISMIFIKRL
ncbi:MAG: Na(+)/H(+) antiporter subunit D [Syntrophorhabdaceae bacterium]|nr:Na(+)/H(+) antiporter subunit D [Syntrophorhabdaceae bacterium]